MWLARILMLMVSTVLLLIALAFIIVLMLASLVRWMFTGKKPTFILFAQAIQRFKHTATQSRGVHNAQDHIIDAEAREVTEEKDRLR